MTEEEGKKLQDYINELEKKIADYKKQEKTIKKLTGKFLLFIFKIFIGKGLKEAFYKLFAEIKEKKTTTVDTLAELAAAIIRRFTRIGLISLIVVLTPVVFSIIQVRLLRQQNDLISNQNKRIDQQTYLVEAQRRNSLVFLMGNIFDEVNNELREDYGKDSIRNLSPQLIGRIIALSHSLTPYRFLVGNELTDKEYSPERGQLLLALLSSGIAIETLDLIYKKANFSDTYLDGVNLDYAHLNLVKLKGAFLCNSELKYAKLNGADLRDANLYEVNFYGSELKYAKLYKANMIRSELDSVDFRHANFSNVNIDSATITLRTRLDSAIISKFTTRGNAKRWNDYKRVFYEINSYFQDSTFLLIPVIE